ncbi:MAG: hypothetical protein ACLUI3_00105 [Christensenellales bacterium]
MVSLQRILCHSSSRETLLYIGVIQEEIDTRSGVQDGMVKKYKTIYADPPWMERGGGKIKRGADRHYPLMRTEDQGAAGQRACRHGGMSPVPLTTNNFLPDALEVVRKWGFDTSASSPG